MNVNFKVLTIAK